MLNNNYKSADKFVARCKRIQVPIIQKVAEVLTKEVDEVELITLHAEDIANIEQFCPEVKGKIPPETPIILDYYHARHLIRSGHIGGLAHDEYHHNDPSPLRPIDFYTLISVVRRPSVVEYSNDEKYGEQLIFKKKKLGARFSLIVTIPEEGDGNEGLTFVTFYRRSHLPKIGGTPPNTDILPETFDSSETSAP